MMEFETTTQPAGTKPIAPDGDGWAMGGAVSASTMPPGHVIFYWQRSKPTEPRVCKSCGAMAFIGTACIGCGTEYKS